MSMERVIQIEEKVASFRWKCEELVNVGPECSSMQGIIRFKSVSWGIYRVIFKKKRVCRCSGLILFQNYTLSLVITNVGSET